MIKENERTRLNKQYWYFRFHEHYFDDIKIIQMQTLPGGFEFLIILFKLYCLSVKNMGLLEIPLLNGKPDTATLAKALRHEQNVVEMALNYFIKEKFVDIFVRQEDDDKNKVVLDMVDMKNMIGKSSAEADRKRELRNEKHKELEEKIEATDRKKFCKHYGMYKNVLLLDNEYEELNRTYKNASILIEKVSLYKKQHDVDYADDYAAVMKFALDDGIKNVNNKELKEKEIERKRKLWETEASVGCIPPEEAKELLGEKEYQRLYEIAEKRLRDERLLSI